MLVSLPVSEILHLMKGSIDLSFTALNIPQSCAFYSVTFELKL